MRALVLLGLATAASGFIVTPATLPSRFGLRRCSRPLSMIDLNHPKIAQDITQLIGRTPLLRLPKIGKDSPAEIVVKLESFSPSNSVKDRIALHMIEEAEKRGDIRPGYTVLVEPTSGNTGIGLAMVGAVKGYEVILCMTDSNSLERRVVMKAFGAKVVLTPGEKSVAGAIKKAQDIIEGLGGRGYMLSQFDNEDNPRAHFATTGPEIWVQTDGEIGAVLGGVGTGGTITGTVRYLKKMSDSVLGFALEPEESPVLSGGEPGSHNIMGIGPPFVPDVCDLSVFDDFIRVTTEEAIEMARRLAKEEGLFVGISSGASVAGALKAAQRPDMKGKRIVAIVPSCGERYLSTVLFQELMQEAMAQEVEDVSFDPFITRSSMGSSRL